MCGLNVWIECVDPALSAHFTATLFASLIYLHLCIVRSFLITHSCYFVT